MSQQPWVVVYDGTTAHGHQPYSMECLRCLRVLEMPVPISIDLFVQRARQFGRKHSGCRPPVARAAAQGGTP